MFSRRWVTCLRCTRTCAAASIAIRSVHANVMSSLNIWTETIREACRSPPWQRHDQWGRRLERWSNTAAHQAGWKRVTQHEWFVRDGRTAQSAFSVPCQLPWQELPSCELMEFCTLVRTRHASKAWPGTLADPCLLSGHTHHFFNCLLFRFLTDDIFAGLFLLILLGSLFLIPYSSISWPIWPFSSQKIASPCSLCKQIKARGK